MIEFFQTHFLAISVFLIITIISILITTSKIDLKRHGKTTALSLMSMALIAALMMMQESFLQSALLKVLVVLFILVACFVLFKYLKSKRNIH